MKPRAVIFDLFGTLTTFSPREYARVEAEMAHVLTVSKFDFSELWTKVTLDSDGGFGTVQESLRYVLRTLGAYTHLDQEHRAIELFLDYERGMLEPTDSVLALLEDLRVAGVKSAIISNTVAIVARLWPDSGLGRLIDVALFSSETGFRKPDPRAYSLAVQKLAVEPGHCVYVGDGDDGELAGAEATGMQAVWLRLKGRSESTAGWQGPTVDSLQELRGLIGI